MFPFDEYFAKVLLNAVLIGMGIAGLIAIAIGAAVWWNIS